MSILLVDSELATKLDQADGSMQLYTRDGRLLGYFSPAKPKTIRFEPPISNEELRRISAEETGRPLADILRDFKKKG